MSIVRTSLMKMGGGCRGRYTIRLLPQMIPAVIGTTFIIYAMVWAPPGDPFVGKCGDRPCPASYIAEMRAKFNLDDSFARAVRQHSEPPFMGNFGEFRRNADGARSPAAPVTLPTGPDRHHHRDRHRDQRCPGSPNRGGFWDNLILVSTLIVIDPSLRRIFIAQFTFGILAWFPPTVGPNAICYKELIAGLRAGVLIPGPIGA